MARTPSKYPVLSGTLPAAVLEEVTWRRPGVVEVVISDRYRTGDPAPPTPSYAPLFSGVGDMALVDKTVKNEGAETRRYFRFQTAMPLASPSAWDGEEAEGETWSANVVLNERNILLHPGISAILKAGWGSVYQNKVLWPRMIYKDTQSISEVTGEPVTTQKPVKNPFFGVRGYFAPRIEVVREKIFRGSGDLNAAALEGLGWLDAAIQNIPSLRSSGVGLVAANKFMVAGHTISRRRRNRVLRTTWTSDTSLVDPVYDKKWQP